MTGAAGAQQGTAPACGNGSGGYAAASRNGEGVRQGRGQLVAGETQTLLCSRQGRGLKSVIENGGVLFNGAFGQLKGPLAAEEPQGAKIHY